MEIKPLWQFHATKIFNKTLPAHLGEFHSLSSEAWGDWAVSQHSMPHYLLALDIKKERPPQVLFL